ncbi:entericidin A/B family lipoprotein [Aquabacterium sp.]|jgi:predicted small secreted protein|nr:entericidin A/B family lipoprotein [Aquabacterium sp.]
MTRLPLIAALSLCLLALSGCNTVHGIGQDLEKAGEAISNAAKK